MTIAGAVSAAGQPSWGSPVQMHCLNGDTLPTIEVLILLENKSWMLVVVIWLCESIIIMGAEGIQLKTFVNKRFKQLLIHLNYFYIRSDNKSAEIEHYTQCTIIEVIFSPQTWRCLQEPLMIHILPINPYPGNPSWFSQQVEELKDIGWFKCSHSLIDNV